MDRQLLSMIAILAIASAGGAESRTECQRHGPRVDASVYLAASPAAIARGITDGRGYDRLLPRFMRVRFMDAIGRRLHMRIDLPWPRRDIEAIVARIERGHGTACG